MQLTRSTNVCGKILHSPPLGATSSVYGYLYIICVVLGHVFICASSSFYLLHLRFSSPSLLPRPVFLFLWTTCACLYVLTRSLDPRTPQTDPPFSRSSSSSISNGRLAIASNVYSSFWLHACKEACYFSCFLPLLTYFSWASVNRLPNLTQWECCTISRDPDPPLSSLILRFEIALVKPALDAKSFEMGVKDQSGPQ